MRAQPIWGVAAVLALAVVARGPRLVESLWYDEIASYLFYASKGPWYVISNYHDPSNHIFHSLLTSFSVDMAVWLGSMEVAFRLPALLFSLLSIVAVQALAREVAGARVGWIAAILIAILPVSVLEGADARGYSMMICFSAAASWALLRGLRAGAGTRAIWIAYALFCALGVWAHLMTVFVPLGHAVLIAALLARRECRGRAVAAGLALLGGGALTILLYVPALDDLLRFYARARGFAASSDQQPTLLGVEGLHALLQLGGAWFWWSALPGLALFAFGLIICLRVPTTCLALAATMLGVPLMVAALTLTGSWVYARFLLFALPGAVLVIALALDWLWARDRRIGLLAILVLVGASAADLVARPPRQPLRDAVELVLRSGNGRAPVIALGLNVPDIAIYEPADFEIMFTTHAGSEFEELIAVPQVRHIIIAYPHLLTPERSEAIRTAGYHALATLPGWADWGRGEVQVWRR